MSLAEEQQTVKIINNETQNNELFYKPLIFWMTVNYIIGSIAQFLRKWTKWGTVCWNET